MELPAGVADHCVVHEPAAVRVQAVPADPPLGIVARVFWNDIEVLKVVLVHAVTPLV